MASVFVALNISVSNVNQFRPQFLADLGRAVSNITDSIQAFTFLNDSSFLLWFTNPSAATALLKLTQLNGRIRQESLERHSYSAKFYTPSKEDAPFLEVRWTAGTGSVGGIVDAVRQKVHTMCSEKGAEIFLRCNGILIKFASNSIATRICNELGAHLKDKFLRGKISVVHLCYSEYTLVSCTWTSSSKSTFTDICTQLSTTGRTFESILQSSVLLWDNQPCIISAQKPLTVSTREDNAVLIVCPSRADKNILKDHSELSACGGVMKVLDDEVHESDHESGYDILVLWLFDYCPLSTGSVFESQDDAIQICSNIDTFLEREFNLAAKARIESTSSTSAAAAAAAAAAMAGMRSATSGGSAFRQKFIAPTTATAVFKKLLYLGQKLSQYSSVTQQQLQDLLTQSNYEQRFFNSKLQTDSDFVIRPEVTTMIDQFAGMKKKPLVCIISSTTHPCNSVLATLMLQGFDDAVLIIASSKKSESIKLARKIYLFDEIRTLHLKHTSAAIKLSPLPSEASHAVSSSGSSSHGSSGAELARTSINDSRKRLEKMNLWRDSATPAVSLSKPTSTASSTGIGALVLSSLNSSQAIEPKEARQIIDLQSLSIASHFKHLAVWAKSTAEQETSAPGSIATGSYRFYRYLDDAADFEEKNRFSVAAAANTVTTDKGFLLYGERSYSQQSCTDDDIANTSVAVFSDPKLKIYQIAVFGSSGASVSRRSASMEAMLAAMLRNRKTYPLPTWQAKHRDCIIGSYPLQDTERRIEATVLFHINEGVIVLAEIVALNTQRHRNMRKFVEDLVPRVEEWVVPRRTILHMKERHWNHIKLEFCTKLEHKSASSQDDSAVVSVKAWGFGMLLDDAHEYVLKVPELERGAGEHDTEQKNDSTGASWLLSVDTSSLPLERSHSMSPDSRRANVNMSFVQHSGSPLSRLKSEEAAYQAIAKMSIAPPSPQLHPQSHSQLPSLPQSHPQRQQPAAKLKAADSATERSSLNRSMLSVTTAPSKGVSREKEKEKEVHGSYTFQDREAGIFYSSFEAEFKSFIEATYGIRVSDVKSSGGTAATAVSSSELYTDAAGSVKSPALKVEFWGLSLEVKALRVYLDKLNAVNLVRTQIFYPRASAGKYKELSHEKAKLDNHFKDVRRTEKLVKLQETESDAIASHSAVACIDPLQSLGFLNVRIKPPMHSRGMKKMLFPADTTVTVCCPTFSARQQAMFEEALSTIQSVRSQYFECTVKLPSQTAIAKRLTARKTRQEFMEQHGVVGIRWEEGSRSTGGVGIAKIWAETSADLERVLDEARAAGGTVEVVPRGMPAKVPAQASNQVSSEYSRAMDINNDECTMSSPQQQQHWRAIDAFSEDVLDDNISTMSGDSQHRLQLDSHTTINTSTGSGGGVFDLSYERLYTPFSDLPRAIFPHGSADEDSKEGNGSELHSSSFCSGIDKGIDSLGPKSESLMATSGVPLSMNFGLGFSFMAVPHVQPPPHAQLTAPPGLQKVQQLGAHSQSGTNADLGAGNLRQNITQSPLSSTSSPLPVNTNVHTALVYWPFRGADVIFQAAPLQQRLAELLTEISRAFAHQVKIAYPASQDTITTVPEPALMLAPSQAHPSRTRTTKSPTSTLATEQSQSQSAMIVVTGQDLRLLLECKHVVEEFLARCAREMCAVVLVFNDWESERLFGLDTLGQPNDSSGILVMIAESLGALFGVSLLAVGLQSSVPSLIIPVSTAVETLCTWDMRFVAPALDSSESAHGLQQEQELISVTVAGDTEVVIMKCSTDATGWSPQWQVNCVILVLDDEWSGTASSGEPAAAATSTARSRLSPADCLLLNAHEVLEHVDASSGRVILRVKPDFSVTATRQNQADSLQRALHKALHTAHSHTPNSGLGLDLGLGMGLGLGLSLYHVDSVAILLAPGIISSAFCELSPDSVRSLTVEAIVNFIVQTHAGTKTELSPESGSASLFSPETGCRLRRIVCLDQSMPALPMSVPPAGGSVGILDSGDATTVTSTTARTENTTGNHCHSDDHMQSLTPALGNRMALTLILLMESHAAGSCVASLAVPIRVRRCNMPLPRNTAFETISPSAFSLPAASIPSEAKTVVHAGRTEAIMRGMPVNLVRAIDYLIHDALKLAGLTAGPTPSVTVPAQVPIEELEPLNISMGSSELQSPITNALAAIGFNDSELISDSDSESDTAENPASSKLELEFGGLFSDTETGSIIDGD